MTNAFNGPDEARSLEENMKNKAGLISKAVYDVLARDTSEE